MTTLNEILNIGFQEHKINAPTFDEYTNGMVKVLVSSGIVVGVFIMEIKVNGVQDIEELSYICKKVNARA